MLKYKLHQDNRSTAQNKGYWYARPVVERTFDLNDLAEHMADHNSPYSKGVIQGVLTDMVSCIRELTADGTAVKIPNLAIFSVGFRSGGAPTVKEFDAGKHIKAFKLRARATGEYSPELLKQCVKVRQYDEYKVSTDEPTDDTGGGNDEP